MKRSRITRIIISILICLLVGMLSGFVTRSSVTEWYPTLEKPFFTPPNWLFAPVWTFLYISMGIAAGIVWARGFYHKWVQTAMYHFVFQLIFNAFWPVVFLGFKKPFLGLLVILTLFILLIFTYKWFKIVSKPAAYLLIPYLIWIGYATALNFEIWRLN